MLVSGFNVYPREVEDALAEHPDVAEVAVIAVPHPYTGEAVKAFVVARAGPPLRPEDVTAHAATRLARFKRPTIVAAGRRAAALGDRQGRQGPAARAREGDRRRSDRGCSPAGHADRQARLPPLRRGP